MLKRCDNRKYFENYSEIKLLKLEPCGTNRLQTEIWRDKYLFQPNFFK